ncbi:hypothetical protein N7539_009439 [Penicillium diatomitis]|uniref:Uncharacterized protein n=1 Tax=Penicillium diatomitis TaxID=2819901 RepID=A0A9W9WKN2_9EURO|nr:uncharacterized protein N7539_009439 [Penicillium diatomitis]KAJ5466710.1 hypothetical protein N7539_009439 [Penicillium diatomitis]
MLSQSQVQPPAHASPSYQSHSHHQPHNQQQVQQPPPPPPPLQHHQHPGQYHYQQAPPPPPPPTPSAQSTPTSIPRSDGPGGPASIHDPSIRKRPLYPAEKPSAPRAIQPRPPASTASYSSESSAQLSPRFETALASEPPRKRGRPSKAETERRKAAAEARGETYPPPRRAGSTRVKNPQSPPSPPPASLAMYSSGPAAAPSRRGPNHGPHAYEAAVGRPLAPAPMFSAGERGEMPDRHSRGGNMRELPRLDEMSKPLPSPRTLHLGPIDQFGRFTGTTPGERSSFGSIPPDRFSPADSGRRDSATSRGETSMGPYTDVRASMTPSDKPTR